MPPPQASGKRREFDPLEVNFVCYLKCLIRGGGRSPAKPVSEGRIPCLQGKEQGISRISVVFGEIRR